MGGAKKNLVWSPKVSVGEKKRHLDHHRGNPFSVVFSKDFWYGGRCFVRTGLSHIITTLASIMHFLVGNSTVRPGISNQNSRAGGPNTNGTWSLSSSA